MRIDTHPHPTQRGSATLAVAVVLLAAATLAVAYGSLGLLVEQRQAGNQLRSTQAFEAAEAGLEWALALLGDAEAIGSDCTPSPIATTTLRDRALRFDDARARFVPRTATRDGAEAALRMACIATDAGGWACHCPVDGAAWVPPFAAGEAVARPAFSVRFAAGPRAGTLLLSASGCDHWSPACLDGDAAAAGPARALARVQVTLALVPALAAPPAAALTVRGTVALGGAPAFVNPDPSTGGLAVHAGGAVAVPHGAATGVPGSPASAALVERDASLGATDADAMFAVTFGLDRARWQQQPGLRTLRCDTPCDDALAALARRGAASAIVRIDGDLRLDGPATIGSAENPVLLVVDGVPRLGADVVIHGAVYVAAAAWNAAGSNGALIRGALLAEGSLAGDGAPSVLRDAAVLDRLHRRIGTLTRVPGSWRDF